MDLRSELPFWTLKNGLIESYPHLNRNISCDLAIVGGGITGALLSYYLIEEGLDTVIVDKREFGFGSTSASTGLLLYENDIDLRVLVRLVGEEVGVKTLQLCRDAIKQIEAITKRIGGESSFARRKSLYVASKKHHAVKLEEEYQLRHKHGFRLKYITKDQLETDFSLDAEAAIVSPGAAQIDPYQFCHQLLRHCMKKGLRAFDRTAMLNYQSRARSVVVSTDRGYTITAKKLVLATGYEAQAHLKQKVVSLKSTYAVVTEPLQDAPRVLDKHLFWETARPYLYARSTLDKRVIIGGGDDDFVDPERRDALIGRKTQKLVSGMNRFFPELPLEPAFSWAGTFGGTKDGLPYIGATNDFPNTYFALGYGGNGMSFSVVASEIIRDLYLRRNNASAGYFRFDR